jgi:hypothetical protein
MCTAMEISTLEVCGNDSVHEKHVGASKTDKGVPACMTEVCRSFYNREGCGSVHDRSM